MSIHSSKNYGRHLCKEKRIVLNVLSFSSLSENISKHSPQSPDKCSHSIKAFKCQSDIRSNFIALQFAYPFVIVGAEKNSISCPYLLFHV